ncbi:MAG TPA: hypothetical protein ENN45_04330 [Bacteroidetes bacterium]|nr:hypothetical protein [Bacteroidota bacterium]
MLTEVKISGVDIDGYFRKWKTIEQFGQEISICELECIKSIYNLLPNLNIGQEVTIKRGLVSATEQFIFDGYIDSISKEGAVVKIVCRDKLEKLMKTQVTYSYDYDIDASAGVGSEIVKDLVETYCDMDADVVATPQDILIKKFICNHVDVFSKVKELADIYDYSLFYDPDDGKVHFEPKGYTNYTSVLTVGSEIQNLPKWIYDFSQCINKLTVLGAEQIVEDTETFDGDGTANQEFTLAKIPISVVCSVGGTIQTPGVRGVTSGSYDYEIDKENKKIMFNQGTNPGVGTGNVSVTYTSAIPIPITISDDVSIGLYGLTEGSKHFSNIQTMDDAEQQGKAFLEKYAYPFVSTKLNVISAIDIDVGNKLRIVDNKNNEDRWVVVSTVERSYPHYADVIIVGDKEWRVSEWGRVTMERIKRLEELTAKNQDMIVEIKSSNDEVAVYGLTQVYSRDIGDAFILGHSTNGKLGTSKLGAGSMGGTELIRTVWTNNTYYETFLTDDFDGGEV